MAFLEPFKPPGFSLRARDGPEPRPFPRWRASGLPKNKGLGPGPGSGPDPSLLIWLVDPSSHICSRDHTMSWLGIPSSIPFSATPQSLLLCSLDRPSKEESKESLSRIWLARLRLNSSSFFSWNRQNQVAILFLVKRVLSLYWLVLEGYKTGHLQYPHHPPDNTSTFIMFSFR